MNIEHINIYKIKIINEIIKIFMIISVYMFKEYNLIKESWYFIFENKWITNYFACGKYFVFPLKSIDSTVRICNILKLKSYQNSIIITQLKYSYRNSQIKSIFNDPDIKYQLEFVRNNESPTFLSHGLDKLWAYSIVGEGIIVAIIGGGLNKNHPDLKQNYCPDLSFNFINNDDHIYETHAGSSTRAAGLISSAANNSVCGVGVAPSSKFTNLQIFNNNYNLLSDEKISRALVHANNFISIYVLTWGIKPRIDINNFMGRSTICSLVNGHKYGRNRLGSIFISGSGMNRYLGNNCAFNEILQRPEIFAFGTISSAGTIPQYLEACTAILASSLSSADMKESSLIYSTTYNNMCNKSAGGTLASSSITAGIIALLLSYNPLLTVRQIFNLIILTSTQYDNNSMRNAAGYLYSYYLGFGLINAIELLEYSKNDAIKNLLDEHICQTYIFVGPKFIESHRLKNIYIYTSGCLDSIFCVTHIEQVFVIFTIHSYQRNSINIFLTSPSGTRFNVIQSRIFDASNSGFKKYRVKILGFYGEKAIGSWKIEILTEIYPCQIIYLELIFHGTCVNPESNVRSHGNVIKYVCANSGYRLTDLPYRLCTSIGLIFDPVIKRDVASFTDQDFYYIYMLNSVISNNSLYV